MYIGWLIETSIKTYGDWPSPRVADSGADLVADLGADLEWWMFGGEPMVVDLE